MKAHAETQPHLYPAEETPTDLWDVKRFSSDVSQQQTRKKTSLWHNDLEVTSKLPIEIKREKSQFSLFHINFVFFNS